MKTLNQKSILAIAVVVALLIVGILNFLPKSGGSKTIRFYAAHGPVEIITKPLQDFKAEVESRTNGNVKVEIVISKESQDTNLAAEKKALELIQNGEYQMGQIYSKTLAQFEKDFLVLEVPFIFKDHNHSFATVDGEIGKDLLAKLESKSNLIGLGYTYCGGYRFVSTKNKTIRTLEDLKGLKLATGTYASTKIMEKLGVQTSTYLEKVQIREMVDQGSLDGLVTVYPRYFYNNEYKISPIANELFFNMQFTVLTMNKEFFHSLSKEEQKIVEESAQKISLSERKIAVEIAEEVSQNSAKYGITVVRMEASEKEKVYSLLGQVDWEKEFQLSSGLINKVKKLAGLQVTGL